MLPLFSPSAARGNLTLGRASEGGTSTVPPVGMPPPRVPFPLLPTVTALGFPTSQGDQCGHWFPCALAGPLLQLPCQGNLPRELLASSPAGAQETCGRGSWSQGLVATVVPGEGWPGWSQRASPALVGGSVAEPRLQRNWEQRQGWGEMFSPTPGPDFAQKRKMAKYRQS